jgi:hypothetical protein
MNSGMPFRTGIMAQVFPNRLEAAFLLDPA